MKRIYHPWDSWECFKAGFVKSNKKGTKEEFYSSCKSLLTNSQKFDIIIKEIFQKWPNSCEHNLTNLEMNRVAWLGQAACTYSLGIDCYTTREAWSHLTQAEKDEANRVASENIVLWERNYVKKV